MNKMVESVEQQRENDALKGYSPVHGPIRKGEAVKAELKDPEPEAPTDPVDEASGEPEALAEAQAEAELQAEAAGEQADAVADSGEEEQA